MATANYFISGVWKNAQDVITHVFVHQVTNNERNFNAGVKTTEGDVIRLIENGHIFKTIVWNYTQATWKVGAQVTVVFSNGRKYLRTQGDSTVRDNLDNLLNMAFAF